MIAMALACNPSLLIADEPTTALDVTIQAQIVELVTKIRQQVGMAVIWITHDLGVVAGIADRVMVMYAGFIVEQASVNNFTKIHATLTPLPCLGALPRVDRRRDRRLKSIPGAPPSLLVEPHGCPFISRCEVAVERCQIENPSLTPVGQNHHNIACWVDIRTGALTMSPTPPLVVVENLTKHFPVTRGIVIQRKVGAVRAVDGISFTIASGETLGLVGRKRVRQNDRRAHPARALPGHSWGGHDRWT